MATAWKWIEGDEPTHAELVDRQGHDAGHAGDSILYHGADWAISHECKALIQSAPDLLAACKLAAEAFVNHLDYDCDENSLEREAYRALQAAIAKAEGQQ